MLDGVAAELRRIIGKPTALTYAENRYASGRLIHNAIIR